MYSGSDVWRSSQISKLISVSVRSHSITLGQYRRRKTDYYINEVYPYGSYQYEREIHAERCIYCRDINSYPNNIPGWYCVISCLCL